MVNVRQFFRFTRIEFVSKRHEHGDTYTLSFRPLRKLHHVAGQHGIFFLPGFSGVHIFSLASAPKEEALMIGTHLREASRYKQRLAALQPGDRMTMIGPVMNFTLRTSRPQVVFLAQGIGITPFRSMLVDNASKTRSKTITLVHVSSPPHTYRELTEKLAAKSYYPTRPDEFSKNLTTTVAQNGYKAKYYIAGSPQFISSTRHALLRLGVPKTSIKRDFFLGY